MRQIESKYQEPEKSFRLPFPVRFCTDENKRVICHNCKKRGWVQVSGDENWNVYFSFTGMCKKIFKRESNYVMNNHQLINHFPNSYVLTRKDFLPKVLSKYVRRLEKMSQLFGKPREIVPKIIPPTFVLPQDYFTFMVECQRSPNTTWIMKPCCSSNGAGIFLTNNMQNFKKWEDRATNFIIGREAKNDSYVVSKYISRPLLIGGKKFDLRLYVLVLSYQPLKAYLFKHGFCRFCNVKYDTNLAKLNNHYIHLTNVSVQRHARSYNRHHGGKWSVHNLKLYLEGTKGREATKKLFQQINEIIVHSLKAVQATISSDLHCFECYGYDVIIDHYFKPWLIEVNSSPSIATTTPSDRVMKTKLFDSILSAVIPPSGCPDICWDKTPLPEAIEEFDLLIDETKIGRPKCCTRIHKLPLVMQRAISCRRSLLKRESNMRLYLAGSGLPPISCSNQSSIQQFSETHMTKRLTKKMKHTSVKKCPGRRSSIAFDNMAVLRRHPRSRNTKRNRHKYKIRRELLTCTGSEIRTKIRDMCYSKINDHLAQNLDDNNEDDVDCTNELGYDLKNNNNEDDVDCTNELFYDLNNNNNEDDVDCTTELDYDLNSNNEDDVDSTNELGYDHTCIY